MPRQVDIVIAEARRHGATDFRTEHGASHIKVRFVFQGRPILFVASHTSSDRRAGLAALTTLRRMMGVKKIVRRKAPHRKFGPVQRHEPPVTCPTLTVFPHPFEPLGAIAARVVLDWRCRRPGLEGTLARIERAGEQAAQRIQAYADAISQGRH